MSDRRRRTLRGALTILTIAWMAVGAGMPASALDDERYTTDNDPLARVSTAPGAPEGSIFAGFENGENVSLYNGNLLVSHASGPVFPMNGGMKVGLTRSFNSKNVYMAEVHWKTEPGFPGEPGTPVYKTRFQGRSWVGAGWTMHLGRYFRRSEYSANSGSGYTGADRYFEDQLGTQHSFEADQLQAHPKLKLEFHAAQEGWISSDGRACCGDSCSDPLFIPPRFCTCDCYWGIVAPAYYTVTDPDGTIYRLDELVQEQTGGNYHWISNSDRAGWYTTRITGVHGNAVRVAYWGDENPAYPEAIKEVWIGSSRKVLWTELWTTADTADPDYDASAPGLLKYLHARGSGEQTATYKFVYEGQTVRQDAAVSGYEDLNVPVLVEVRLPQPEGGASGSVGYGYSMVSTSGSHSRPLLSEVRYPTGGASTYLYGVYVAGRRSNEDCPAVDPHPGSPPRPLCSEIWPRRLERGVTVRTLYPEGLPASESDPKPHTGWSWFREFYTEDPGCETVDSNVFRLTSPGGQVTESQFYGHPCGKDYWDPQDGPDGWEKSKTFMAGGGVTPLRSESYEYDYRLVQSTGNGMVPVEVMQKKKVVTFHDDLVGQNQGEPGTAWACFGGTAPADGATPRRVTTVQHQRDADNHWRLTREEGDYLESRRITRTDYLAACTGSSVLDRYASVVVEEGSERVESKYTFDCDGLLTYLRAKDEKRSSTPPPASPQLDASWESWNPANLWMPDSDDVVHDLAYFADGNLSSIDYSGGDAAPDGTRNAYGFRYTWEYGLAKTVRVVGLAYDSRSVRVDAAGFVTAGIDPNGRETAFQYDALGRLTRIDPPGTEELPTRVVYPDLTETRILRSPGEETDWSPADEAQSFARQLYDGLGRVVERHKAMPGGALSVQVTRYDPAGRAIFASEWMDRDAWLTAPRETWSDASGHYFVEVPLHPGTGRPWGTVTFYGTPSVDPASAGNPLRALPDGLGRVVRVVSADGATVDHEYCGPHEAVTVRGVRTAIEPAVAQDSTTTYYRDGNGRLVLVDAPAGGADAEYRYDINGKLTRVNLVADLPSDPFTAWKAHAIADGQVREFEYDALGNLRRSRVPEQGETGTGDAAWSWIDRYDSWRKPLVARDPMAVKRGTYLETRYDAAGRAVLTRRVRGTPDAPEAADVDRLGGRGSFDSSLDLGPGAWEEGTIRNGVFQPGDSYWRRVEYPYPGGSTACLIAPPGQASGGGLYFGDQCSFAAAPAGPQAVRILASGVTRDDVLRFKHWRQVHSGEGLLDAFDVFVTLASDGNETSNRRGMFRLDQSQSSFARWQQSLAVRPGDLYDGLSWPEGQTRDLYVYLVFEKGVGDGGGDPTGLVVDDVFLGRKGIEVLAEFSYDQDACASGTAPEACESGEESANAFKGNPTATRSYQDGWLLSERTLAYKGLNGRLSAEQLRIDWSGVGTSTKWVARSSYGPTGAMDHWVAPHQPGIDEAVAYDLAYRRDFLDGIGQAGGDPFLVPAANAMRYDPAGNLLALRFANGAVTEFARDEMSRPKSILVGSPSVAEPLWTSGTYSYDGAGNIVSIGTERFAYDLNGRLREAWVAPQARDPLDGLLKKVSYGYDLFGNMTDRDWGLDRAITLEAPLGFEFLGRQHGAPGTTSRNRITDPGFEYDLAGNLTRMLLGGGPKSALWDSNDRMKAFYNGDAATPNSRVAERYAYDTSGYRVVRYPEGGNGEPVISLRDGSGRLLAEYRESPADGHPVLATHFVYGAGQLLVERRRVDVSLPMSTQSTGSASETGSKTIGARSQTADTPRDRLPATANDTRKRNPEARLADGLGGGEARTSTREPVPSQGSAPADRSPFDVTGNGTGSPAGDTGIDPDGPGTGSADDLARNGSVDDGTPPGIPAPSGPTFVNEFHHRDHLGSLRVVTDASGSKVSGHDYYPFGTEMLPNGEAPATGSTKRFTGHERDAATGLDYMLARYYGSGLARFLSTDPGSDSNLGLPQSWNAFAYVRNAPIGATDPTGKYGRDFHYDVTYYLALLAGNSESTAKTIAQANQGVDDNKPAFSLKALFTDRDQWELHFMEPDKAAENVLEADSSSSLGEALHSLQDTHSHKGFGWPLGHFFQTLFGRDPDNTANNVEEALAAARETFRAVGGDPKALPTELLRAIFKEKDPKVRRGMLRRVATELLAQKRRARLDYLRATADPRSWGGKSHWQPELERTRVGPY